MFYDDAPFVRSGETIIGIARSSRTDKRFAPMLGIAIKRHY